MATQIGSAAKSKLIERLTAPRSSLAGLIQESSGAPPPRVQNAAADLVEKSTAMQYPAISVYCDRVVNDLHEKFRSFSGTVRLAIEVRHSQDRLEGIEDALEQYADGVTQVLTASRGDWGDGMFYAGAYEVTFGAAKRGGRNFTQAAKITFEVGVSRT